MERRTVIESRMAALETELAQLDQFGEDSYEEGTVLIFSMRFHKGGTRFTYAALKAGGKWHTTGNRVVSYGSWDDLVTLWQKGVGLRVRVVTQSKRVL